MLPERICHGVSNRRGRNDLFPDRRQRDIRCYVKFLSRRVRLGAVRPALERPALCRRNGRSERDLRVRLRRLRRGELCILCGMLAERVRHGVGDGYGRGFFLPLCGEGDVRRYGILRPRRKNGISRALPASERPTLFRRNSRGKGDRLAFRDGLRCRLLRIVCGMVPERIRHGVRRLFRRFLLLLLTGGKSDRHTADKRKRGKDFPDLVLHGYFSLSLFPNPFDFGCS